MSFNNLVSLIIPVFNGEKYILKCLTSVLHQSYPNIEVIVLDDASTDNTAEIVKNISDKRILYYKNEKNLGWRLNVSRGYELCKGEFVTICPVDDFLMSTFVEEAVKIFISYPEVGIWGCGAITIDEAGNIMSENLRPRTGLISSKDYFRYTYTMVNVSPPSETMLRKTCLDAINVTDCYKTVFKQFPEINAYLKISGMGYGAYHSIEKLCYRTSRSDSLTGKYGQDPFILLDNYNIFYNYIENGLLDNKTILLANHLLFIKCIRMVKHHLKKGDTLNIIKILKIFLNNDYKIRLGNAVQKSIRFVHFLFLNSVHLFIRNIKPVV